MWRVNVKISGNTVIMEMLSNVKDRSVYTYYRYTNKISLPNYTNVHKHIS